MSQKVVSVVGARPQFIKLGPLSRELRKRFDEIIVHTGQHYDEAMSDLFFRQLEIPMPDFNLDIGSATHGAQTGRMLESLERILIDQKPDLVITFGDTNSTLAASLASSKLEIPSVHIEAGLRSFNRSMPEEINRIVADHTADLLFAPTQTAADHLKREGLSERTIVTGDIMVDSVQYVQSKLGDQRFIDGNYDVLTLHRPYNVDHPEHLKLLFASLELLSNPIVFPVHPRTRNIIKQHQIRVPSQVKLLEPLGYIEFQSLLKYANKVITDSGGLQKEAYILGKPCITLRSETEWTETVESGWNILMDMTDPELADKIQRFNPGSVRPDLYGKQVALQMVQQIERFLRSLAG